MTLQPSKLKKRIEITAGDTLESLAFRHLGDGQNWRELADINEIDIFEPLQIGTLLDIPNKDELQRRVNQAAEDLSDDLNLTPVLNKASEFKQISWIL
ncbi:MAG: LysM peptidoglycan-binding domain-containing protein [Elainellaceae cyanobacterium]